LQKEDALFGRDRDFASVGYNTEAGNSTSSGNTFPANNASLDGTVPSSNPSAATGCVAPYSFLEPGRGTASCRFDPAGLVTLLPATDKAGLFASAKFTLAGDFEAFVEASFTRNKQRTVIQPVPLSDQFTIPPNNPLANTAPYNDTTITAQPSSTIILQSTSPYYPTAFVQGITGGATPDLLVRYRAAVSGNRDITDTSQAPRLSFGVRGSAAGWDVDSAFLYSASKVTEQVNDGYPVLSQILPLLNSGNVNFFGANTPEVEAQIRATNFLGEAFNVKSTLTSVAGKASRDLMNLSAGPLALAVGAEFRREQYDFQPSTELAQGDLAGYGGNIAAVDRSRGVASAFGEVSVPVVKGLDVDAAVRFDRYAGVGNSTTPKLSFRWQPAAPVLLRGSIGKGFRAPSLADLYAPQTQGVSQTGLDDPLRCPTTGDGVKDCATQFGTVNGGNTALTPEKSTNATLGIVFEPFKGASIGVDAFNVHLTNTITQGLAQTFILANLDKYGSFVVRGPVDPATPTLPGQIISINQQNINLGATKVAGVDVDARWRWTAGDWGRFTVAFNGTYFSKYDTENPDGSFSPNVGNLDQSTSGGVIARVKTYQSLSWAYGDWDTALGYRYQSGYKDLPSNLTGVDRRVGAYELFDLQASYAVLKGLRLTVGVRNLLDRDPPYSNQGFSFQSGYDPQYADPRGRFVYAGVNYRFD
jgi:iron complex outermembrane receptor protein